MSGKPRIFISAVASEFASLRLDVADLLGRLGFEPLICDVDERDSNDQRPRVREIIDRCDGLLQIVGGIYGPEPPTIDPELGRVSYAEFEYLYADKHKKKTWVILAQPGLAQDPHRDHPGSASDPSTLLGTEGDRTEQEKRQGAYRLRLQQAGQIWCEVADETELGLAIERLADERASLRRRFRPWQSIRPRHAAALLSVAAISGFLWLAVRWQNNRSVARELASIDTTQIRAQLEKSIGDVYAREASGANQLPDSAQRRKALGEANRRRFAKRADLDAVVDLVTGTITAGHASPEFLEMSHVLQQKGVDAALASLSRHEGQLLERARAAAAKQERGLRRTLSVLLLAIPLLRDGGDLAEAERLSEKLLAAEPDWPPAQQQRIITAMHSGERALAENRPMTAWQKFVAARTSAEQLLQQDPRNRLCQGQLAVASLEMGELTYKSNRWGESDQLLHEGVAIARKRAAADQSDFEAQWALLEAYGKAAAIHLRLGHFGEAVQIFRQGHQLAGTIAAGAEHDEAVQRELADWYAHVGQDFLHSGRARPEAFTASVEIGTKLATAHPQDVQSQRDVAAAYECLGSLENGVGPFFFKSLEIRKRVAAGAPREPEFQHDLAALYEKMGTQAAREVYRVPIGQRAVVIQQAREFYGHDLEIVKQLAEARPADQGAQHDLAVCYKDLADFSRQTQRSADACEYRQQQIDILAKLSATDPTNSATQQELAAAYDDLGNLSWQADDVDRARDAFQRAFDLYARLAADGPVDLATLSHVDQSCANLARVAHWRGDLDAAEKICRRGIALVTQLCDTPEGADYLKSGVTYSMNNDLRECERTRVCIGPLDALLKKPAEQVPSLLNNRLDHLAARRDIAGVAKTADVIARLKPKSGWNLFCAARGYALCVKLASGWTGSGPFPPKDTAKKSAAEAAAHAHTDRQKYARAAVEMLQAAVKAGFKNVTSARRDRDFAALRDLSDFKKLVGETPK